ARTAHHRAIVLGGPAAGRKVVEKLAERQPAHPSTRLLKAMQAVEDGRVGTALVEFSGLDESVSGIGIRPCQALRLLPLTGRRGTDAPDACQRCGKGNTAGDSVAANLVIPAGCVRKRVRRYVACFRRNARAGAHAAAWRDCKRKLVCAGVACAWRSVVGGA